MVAAVERLMKQREGQALLETLAILIQAYDDRQSLLPPVAPKSSLTS